MKRASSTARSSGKPANRPATLWSYAFAAAATGLGGLLIAALLVWFAILPAAAERAASAQAAATAGHLAALYDGRIRELERSIGTLAGSAPVREALQNGNPDVLAATGRMLTGIADFAERVALFAPGQGAVDLEASVPISFAALELVRRAEAGSFAGPDAIGGERRAIYAAQPVAVDSRVIGTLLVAVAPHFFPDLLATHDSRIGRVTLEQVIDGRHAIAVVDFGAAQPGSIPHRVPVAAANWVLTFQPAVARGTSPMDPVDLAVPFAAAAILLLAGLVFVFQRIGAAARRDADLLRDSLTATRGPGGAFRLAVFATLAESLTPASHPVSAASAPADPAPADAGPSTSDDANAADNDFLEIRQPAEPEEPGIVVTEQVGPLDLGLQLDPEIFRAYDIRGITTRNLTEDVVYWIGRAFAAEALDAGTRRVVVGRDGRHSSSGLRDALVRGLREGGCNVLDIGEVPTPLLYFATHVLETGTGVMLTGSHNPPEYNGLKMMLGGTTLADERIQALRLRIEENRLSEGDGSCDELDLREDYLERVVTDVVVAQPLKVVVDCGNGVAGALVPELLQRLDCDVIPLYCEVDGDFPNHHPDPADPTNLEDLITVVRAEQADLGLAFDGDGDRLGVVTGAGTIIWPDRLMMLFAQDIVGRNPGADIIYDVKCSRHLNLLISELGGRPILSRTGHSHIKARMQETGALLGGEFSGHICFGERWFGFDDALYAAARLLEILGAGQDSAEDVFARYPQTVGTPELKIETGERAKFEIVDRLAATGDFADGTLTTIDGVRVDYADGWGLIRASNTSPVLTLRFEADDAAALERIQGIFEAALARIDPGLGFRQHLPAEGMK